MVSQKYEWCRVGKRKINGRLVINTEGTMLCLDGTQQNLMQRKHIRKQLHNRK